jgi:hypothetical protein
MPNFPYWQFAYWVLPKGTGTSTVSRAAAETSRDLEQLSLRFGGVFGNGNAEDGLTFHFPDRNNMKRFAAAARPHTRQQRQVVIEASVADFVNRLLEDDPNDQDTEVGDEVTVVDQGRSYTGRVGARNPDGTLKLSFSGPRPAKQDYKKDELRRDQPSPSRPPTPGSATSPTAGRAPGSFL